jgi:endonuclease III related protein
MKITPEKLCGLLQEKIGPLDWWPVDNKFHDMKKSDPRFEIMIGAVLTQNTAWSNVEKALVNLKENKMLNIKKLSEIEIKDLQKMIKSSGFFNQKADRLKNFSRYLQDNYKGDLDFFFNKDLYDLRKELLTLDGIGPETADSIILYAGNLPIFVVDAYTKRICKRLPIKVDSSYEEIQKYFQDDLSKKYKGKKLVKVYNQLHAQIVILSKNYCKKKPLCNNCVIKDYCKYKKELFQ